MRITRERMALLTSIPEQNQESAQGLRYQIGQKYDAHEDAFPRPLDGEKEVLTVTSGFQRTATVLLYLQSPTEGGATSFPFGISLAAMPPSLEVLAHLRHLHSVGSNPIYP